VESRRAGKRLIAIGDLKQIDSLRAGGELDQLHEVAPFSGSCSTRWRCTMARFLVHSAIRSPPGSGLAATNGGTGPLWIFHSLHN